ncbi:MAG TPA: AmmeMemoRadiSam system protein B [Candidatus Deferrimicrobium sp.]|nr:AmmeMemoRadiSam system protein B [Candidatus Deferrimicrobium sp.]
MIRDAKFAGSWYNGSESALRQILKGYFETDKRGPKKTPTINADGPRNLVGIVSPHAGYMYSGAIAAHGFAEIAFDGKPDFFIVVGIDHHGYGAGPASIQCEGGWQTPLGLAKIKTDVAKKILANSQKIYDSAIAHNAEHSLELQLPFLQYIFGEIEFIPIMVSSGSLSVFQEVGRAIAEGCKGEDVVLIASTDFTHMEAAEFARAQDQKAIDAILKLDEKMLYETVRKNGISMCGYGSTSAVIKASRELGATKAVLLKYGNSGEVTGDDYSVVGYGSLKLVK